MMMDGDSSIATGGTKGAFVTFEGGEGSGKSSVCANVSHMLANMGYDCWSGSEPGCTVLGSCWREQILNPDSEISPRAEMLLFLADRAQNFAENVAPRLEAGCVVILDRHRDSTMAYQGAGRGHDMDLIEACNHFATEGRKPDMTVLLDIDPEAGLRRSKKTEYGAADRIEVESLEFHKRLHDAFLAISRSEPERFVVLDASKPMDYVVARALDAIKSLLHKVKVTPA